mgnify:FL=1
MATKYDWRYQVVKHDGWYGLHEVHLADDVVHSWTENPITFTGESPDEIIKSLQMAIADCKKLPAFENPDGD